MGGGEGGEEEARARCARWGGLKLESRTAMRGGVVRVGEGDGQFGFVW